MTTKKAVKKYLRITATKRYIISAKNVPHTFQKKNIKKQL